MSLRETALRGGANLVGREVVGLVLRFGGVLIITRLIGPANFGLYAGALAIVTVFTWAAQLGAEVFLIRREEEPPTSLYDQVFTTLLVSTACVVVTGMVGSVMVGFIIDSASALLTFQVLLLALPLSALWAPAQAKLERGFQFRSMAFLQVSSDAVLYGVAIVIALAGAGVWAPIAGTFAAYGWQLVGSYTLAGYRPRIDVSRDRMVALVRFGLAFTPAGLLGQAQNLINPLIVGPVLGASSVGYVALATRLADTASFVLRVTYRVSLVVLGRVQNDRARVRRGFEEMLLLQAVGVGVPLAMLGVAAPWLIAPVFGNEWEPTLDVLPFVSFGLLALGIFNTHLALLYILGKTLATSVVGLARFALFAASALLLVPAFGLVGYGLAVLASTLAWLLADRELKRQFRFSYGAATRWVIAVTPSIFIPLLDTPWGLLLTTPLLGLVLFDHTSRRQLRRYLAIVASSLNRREGDVDETA